MKKILYLLIIILSVCSCDILKEAVTKPPVLRKGNFVKGAIDLVAVVDDKIKVQITPAPINSNEAIFYIPETVPGTYSDDDYGIFIDSLRAYTASRSELKVKRLTDNSWQIENAKNLEYINYYVNDTYDIESTHKVFSPAGTNILDGEQFMLNLHAVLGYFEGQEEYPFYLDINRPETLEATTSLPRYDDPLFVSQDFSGSGVIDTYKGDRYFNIIDNPIMYNNPNKEIFDIEGITIELSVYSPTGLVKASELRPNVERMMAAQKKYLGDFNATDRYSILLYLTTSEENDAQGYGALEHHNSTVVVLPEGMPQEAMDKAIIDVVAHEFFHIVTPLNLHSTQIHKFKYNNPEMSKHLWMYEGVTEYFAQHFQVQQGLISPAEFYAAIVSKISNAKTYEDSMSFTKMSENILEEPYASNYGNVYEKGALIGMCLDILIRSKSNGEKGLLNLMKKLTEQYGPNRPFEDTNLIREIEDLTYPEVGTFFKDHVIGTIPINYSAFFDLVGLEYSTQLVNTGYFLDGQFPYINGNPNDSTIYILPGEMHSFFRNLGIEGGDVIKSVNRKEYNLTNAYSLIEESNNWRVGDAIEFVVLRDGIPLTLAGKIVQPQIKKASIIELQYFTDSKELETRRSWLKGS